MYVNYGSALANQVWPFNFEKMLVGAGIFSLFIGIWDIMTKGQSKLL